MDVTATKHYSTWIPSPKDVRTTEYYGACLPPLMDVTATEYYSAHHHQTEIDIWSVSLLNNFLNSACPDQY